VAGPNGRVADQYRPRQYTATSGPVGGGTAGFNPGAAGTGGAELRLPLAQPAGRQQPAFAARVALCAGRIPDRRCGGRSEEHTSELQSRENLVCRLLLEKKK